MELFRTVVLWASLFYLVLGNLGCSLDASIVSQFGSQTGDSTTPSILISGVPNYATTDGSSTLQVTSSEYSQYALQFGPSPLDCADVSAYSSAIEISSSSPLSHSTDQSYQVCVAPVQNNLIDVSKAVSKVFTRDTSPATIELLNFDQKLLKTANQITITLKIDSAKPYDIPMSFNFYGSDRTAHDKTVPPTEILFPANQTVHSVTVPLVSEGHPQFGALEKDHQLLFNITGSSLKNISVGRMASARYILSNRSQQRRYVDVETSLNHTCALDTDNRLYCFGASTKDFLGTSSDANSPREVNSSLRFTDIAGGYDHTCAIQTDGQALCFGVTNNPACGTGDSPNDCETPTLVQGGHLFSEIDAGSQTNCAIEQGTNLLYCWGNNNNNIASQTAVATIEVPTLYDAGIQFKKIKVGDKHACGIDSNNKILCWGANTYGQLGTGNTTAQNTPNYVVPGISFKEIASGSDFTCAISNDNELYCWGLYFHENPSDATDANLQSTSAVQIHAGTSYDKIFAGKNHFCARNLNDQALYCMGDNSFAELGTGSGVYHFTPTKMLGDHQFTKYDFGIGHGCGVNTAQELLCSGNFANGQTGQARSGDQILITPNILLPTLKKVTVGGFSSCAIDSNDNALCSGPNDRGRIGTGSQHWRPTFFPIVSPLKFKDLTSGESFHCGLSADGTAYCWGRNLEGQVGDGTKDVRLIPTAAVTSEKFTSIVANRRSVCALSTNQDVYCWGSNAWGQLGSGDFTEKLLPTKVSGSDKFKFLTASYSATCGIKTDDTIRCWGANTGALGLGADTANKAVPTAPGWATQYDQVAIVNSNSCAIRKSDKRIECWGLNTQYEHGNGSTTASTTPTAINSSETFAKIYGGTNNFCALTTSQRLFCWGYSYYHDIGKGVLDSVSTFSSYQTNPTELLPAERFVDASVQKGHTCAVTTSGNLKCWGGNVYSQMGDGYFQASARAPVYILRDD